MTFNRQPPSWRDPRVLYGGILGLLITFFVVLLWEPLLIEGRVPVNGEVMRFVYPTWRVLDKSGPLGNVFLWNPYRDMGEPFLADPRTLVTYPLRWFTHLSDGFCGFLKVWILVHTLIAAYFTGKLVFKWYGDRWAAGVSALLAGANGFFTGHAPYPNQFAAAAYLPAVLYFQACESSIGLGVGLALQWSAGYPPFFVLTLLALLTAAMARGRSSLMVFLKGGLLGAGLSAVQWIPFMELFRSSEHPFVLSPSIAGEFSLPPGQLLKELAMPQWTRFSPHIQGDPVMVSFYVGLVAVGLALWGAARGNSRERRWGLITLVSLLLSLGVYLPGYAHLTWLHVFRFPASWLMLTSMGIALLSGAGMASLSGIRWKETALALVALDLVVFSQVGRVAWFEPAFLDQPPPIVAYLQGQPDPTRIYHPRFIKEKWLASRLNTLEDYQLMKDMATPSYGTAFGVREVDSYQILRLKRAENFLERLQQEGPQGPGLRWAGVSVVATFDRATGPMARERLKMIQISGAKPPLFLTAPDLRDAVHIDSYKAGEIQARVDTSKTQTLVFSEVFDNGWHAAVDGLRQDVGLFENTFMTVQIPAGSHRITLWYDPASFHAGLGVSMATALGLFVYLVKKRGIRIYRRSER